MKNIWITAALSSILLSSCGGSGGDSTTSSSAATSKSEISSKLANTNWEKACSPENKLASDDSATLWNVKIKLEIDASLRSTYKAEYFRPTDTACDSMMFDTLDISRLEIQGKVISEESIEAFGLIETFIYKSESNDLPTKYSLIYLDSERLYFGQQSGDNLGETAETRHSSISLDNYFTQVIN